MSYTKSFIIPELICDKDGILSIRNLVSLMAEVSTEHSYKLESKMDMDRFRWIVYSWDIAIDEPIRAYDHIEVTTMATGIRKFYAYRNVLVKRDNRVIAKAYGIFMLVDIKRLRPIKLNKQVKESSIMDEEIYKKEELTYRDDFNKSKKILVRYTDIDRNLHVNNAVYFDYICDLCKLDSKDIRFFNIVYKNEIRNKDSLIGEYIEDGGEINFRLKSEDGKTIYTYGKIRKNV